MSAEQQAANGAEASDDEPQKQDVWLELFGILQGLAETTALALQAFTPSDDKSVSATTKKRLALRSVQGLKQSQQGLQVLLEHLKALQAASHTWQRTMMYASKGQQELMEQVESSTRELHSTSDRLRSVEAHRLSSVREAEALRAQVARLEQQNKGLQSGLKQREEELESVQFTVHEVQADASATQQRMEQLRQAAEEAAQRAAAAAAGLGEARADAAKAQNQAERHQQVVAKLTADNLLFLMQLKKAEADLAAANQERVQLRLAAEQQRGPWFDQVRAGVEERVRQALQRSQELEGRLEQQAAEHGSRIEAIESQRAHLEGELSTSRGQGAQLEEQLGAALAAQQRAQEQGASAEAAASELRQRLEALAAENRVLQESVRSMRQECTERWVSEQAALGRVGGLEDRLQALEAGAARQAAAAASLQRQLEAQAGVNRQLMARKEEVEWQLMAAKAQLDGGDGEAPVPLNLLVSGLLQVGGGQEQQRHAPPPPAAAATAPAPAGSGGVDAPAQAERLTGPHQPTHAAAGQQHAGSAHTHASAAEPATHAPAPRPASDAALPGNGAAAPQQPAPRPAPPQPQPPLPAAILLYRPAEAPALAPRPRLWQGSTDGSEAAGPVLSREPTLSLGDRGSPDAHPNAADAYGAAAAGASAADRSDAWDAGYRAGAEAEGRQWGAAGAPRHPLPGAGAAPGPYGPRAGGGGGGASDSVAHLHETTSAGGGSATAPSSPPSSVALSAEPEWGSPGGGAASRVPSTSSSRMRVAATAAAAAAVTIRTAPGAGQPGPSGGEGGGGAAPAGGGGLGSRRGSLHDGEGIWLDMAPHSPRRSDDGFGFIGAGVALQRTAHGAAAAPPPPPPPPQAMLVQLQQQLQVQLQAPAAAAAAVTAYDAPAAPLLDLQPGMQPLGSWQEYRSWQGGAHAQASPSGSGGGPTLQVRAAAFDADADGYRGPHRPTGGGRPSIVMRTGPSQPPGGPSDRGAGSGASAPGRGAGGSGMHAWGDAAEVGVFSIVRSGAAMSPARATAAGSPVHPAFRATLAAKREPEAQQQQQGRADPGSPSRATAVAAQHAPASPARSSVAPPSPPRSPPHPAVFVAGAPPAGAGPSGWGTAQGATSGGAGGSGRPGGAAASAQVAPGLASGAEAGVATSAVRPRVSFQGLVHTDEGGGQAGGGGGARGGRPSEQDRQLAPGQAAPQQRGPLLPAPAAATASAPSGSPPPGAYRPAGATQHPALMGAPPAGPGAAYGVDPADATPSKRYSAASVRVTSVPRGGGA